MAVTLQETKTYEFSEYIIQETENKSLKLGH